MRKIVKLLLSAVVILITFSGIAEAENWVQVINQTNKHGVQFDVYMDTNRTVFHKRNNNPYDYVGDTITTEIKYNYRKGNLVIQEGNRGYTFSLDGKWYASSGGHCEYTNVFGTFSKAEDSFTIRELYDEEARKICKAVLDYYFNHIAQ